MMKPRSGTAWRVVAGAMALAAGAQAQLPPIEEPVVTDEGLVYPQGAAIPRSLTQVERWWLAGGNGAFAPRGSTFPTGPVHCASEYEAMQAILLSWNGSASWLTIVSQMAARITNEGQAEAWVVVRNAASETTARTQIAAAGANMARVRFHVRVLDTIWIRDYGPRYIFEGDCRAIVDHTYNRPRPNDDGLPGWIGQQLRHKVYNIPLVHGGGNYHLDGVDRSYATRLIANENRALTEAQIIEHWRNYQGVETHLFDPFPQAVDSTQHLDMWMIVIADDKVIISDWPNNSGSAQDIICDAATTFMSARGYQVTRMPAFSIGGTHYTFVNAVMCNAVVLVPSYTQTTVATFNAAARTAWQSALPEKQIVQIPCQAIVTAAGVMHCIAMHVPSPRAGVNPSAYVKNLNGGELLTPGEVFTLRWLSDDDRATTTADVLLSTDGGLSYPVTLASGIADVGAFDWTPAAMYTRGARVRVVLRDAEGNTGTDSSDADFQIGTCAADLNLDGEVSFLDYEGFVVCFQGGACPEGPADFNRDGSIDFFDYADFVEAFETGC